MGDRHDDLGRCPRGTTGRLGRRRGPSPIRSADDDPPATDRTGVDHRDGRMTHRLPALVELPDEVPETAVWPELAASLGDEAGAIGPHQRRWLTIATLHRSALYEDVALSAVASRHCLALLENVGNAAFELELQTAIGRREPGWGAAQRSETITRIFPSARRALVDVLGVAVNARLGAGEHRQQLLRGQASRSLDSVTLQLLGWWSLLSPGRTIRNPVRRVHAALMADGEAGVDWRTLFHQSFDRLAPQFAYTRAGADHETVFQATVTTRDGRSGTGSGARKKDASQLACRDYLRRYSPRLLERPASAGPPPSARALPVHAEHWQLAALFGVPDAALFSEALTHFSWVYENTPDRNRRASNEVLAYLGSSVLRMVTTRTRAAYLLSTTARPDPDMSTVLTLPDENLVPLGDALGLRTASRAGSGQRSVSVEMLANFVQAVLAAAYVQAGDVGAFEERLPEVVADFLVEQGGRSLRDAATRLQELAVELDLEFPSTDRQTGPDHAPAYRNTMQVTGGSATVVVKGTGPGRTAAKKAAAAVAMAAAGLRSGAPIDVDRPDVARFFLMRQLEALAGKPNRWPRWHQHNVLAARHIADRDWAAFGRWVDAVRRTGFLDLPVPAALQESLAEFYQRAARSAGARPRFTDTLSRVLRWVGDAVSDDRMILQSGPWKDLVELTAAHGVWLATDGTADLAAVLERWARPERRRVPVEIEVAGPAEVGAQAAAAAARILHEFRQAPSGVVSGLRARLVPGGTTHEIRLSSGTGGEPGSESLAALVCEAAPGVSVEHRDGGTTVRVARWVTGSSWLWEAAIRTRRTDEYDVELARLLHDLKNEVTGARTALGRPTATRTERREADLDASRHIDSAAALAARLADAKFLYHSAPAGSCDLTSFLRSYCSDLINRLPPGIRVIPPVMTPAPVAVDTAVLRSAFDNLVKNAVEAMGDQGQIEFEYTLVAGDGVVLLELRDTGPGLPDEVVAALQASGPAPTSKRYGSGLGLPGVMRMMRRAGADLQPLRTEGGGAWLIRLPLAGEGGATNG